MLIAITLLAFNLRPPAIAIAPVLPEIRADLGFGGVLAGVLTTLPPLCFAVFGVLSPAIAARLGLHQAALLSLLAIAIGQAVRVIVPLPAVFFVATILALIGMATGNVLLPSLVRRHFPDRIGRVTGTYSLALGMGVALASLLSVPLATMTGSWRWSLGVWIITALIAAVPWLRLATEPGPNRSSTKAAIRIGYVARTRVGWILALFFGIQSIQAYAIFGWLPTIYIDAGLDPASAGLMLTITTGLGLPLAFWVPHHIVTSQRPQLLVAVMPTCGLIGFLGLLIAPTTLPWLWATLLAVDLASFPAFLALTAMRGQTSSGTAALAGFSQSVGYFLAAIGPFAMGLLSEMTGGWTAPLIFLLALCVPLAIFGQLAVRPRSLESELASRTSWPEARS
ncbi:MAG TPA: MFS transporter [Propionibacteriaceae bacterium]|nr:MFS transporter [Propionibacteriaceae bacterium]